MKFLIIGDLHGSKPKIHFKDFDAIIAPGDFCSDKIRKYMKGWMEARDKKGRRYKDDVDFLIDKYGKRFVEKIHKESLQIGIKVLEYLNSFGKPVFIIPGNWDDSYGKVKQPSRDAKPLQNILYVHKLMYSEHTNKKLTKGLKNIIDCQFRLINFKDFNFLGYGLSMVPEIKGKKSVTKKVKGKLSKKEFKIALKSYNNLFSKLEERGKKADSEKSLIFLSHNMPYDTKFDKIIKPGTIVHGAHYGSVVARDFILKYKPLVCIGGHMHEYFGKFKMGRTTVINAGFGPKVNTLLEIENGKIKKLEFWNGEEK